MEINPTAITVTQEVNPEGIIGPTLVQNAPANPEGIIGPTLVQAAPANPEGIIGPTVVQYAPANPEGIIDPTQVQAAPANPYPTYYYIVSYVPYTTPSYYSNAFIPANYARAPTLNYSYPIQYVAPTYSQYVQPAYYTNTSYIPMMPTHMAPPFPPQYERIQVAEPKGAISKFFDKIYNRITGKTRTNWRDIENAKYMAPPKSRIMAGNLEYTYRNTKVKKISSPRKLSQLSPRRLSPRRLSSMQLSPRRVRPLTPQESLNQSNYGFDFPTAEKGSFFDV